MTGGGLAFFPSSVSLENSTLVRIENPAVCVQHGALEVGALYISWDELDLATIKLLGQGFTQAVDYDIVKLSTIAYYDGDFYQDCVMVMLVGHPSDGLAERLAIGHMLKSFWDSEPRLTKEIVLG